MLWIISLLAGAALAQDCNVNAFSKASQKRRECASRDGCKWSGRKEVSPGNFIAGSCAASSNCAALTQNQCKKRNNCFINWTTSGKPCEDYDETVDYPCDQLSGKKNFKKCKDQANCINGSGDRDDKTCLTRPTDIATQDCNNFSNRPNKNLCLEHPNCEWVIKNKKCIDKPSIVKTCSNIDEQQECEANHSGCKWENNLCSAQTCLEITDRTMCNSSKNDCQWYSGFVPDDFDHKKNKQDQKDDPNNTSKFETEGSCREGFDQCRDIMVENHCKLASSKYGINNCKWNPEAKEITGAFRCNTATPCRDHTDTTNCLLNDNMFGDKCVWQKSGATMRCMEFACDNTAVDTKNKCNTVGCHWHRNKDKRDPNAQGYCGVFDTDNGRRL